MQFQSLLADALWERGDFLLFKLDNTGLILEVNPYTRNLIQATLSESPTHFNQIALGFNFQDIDSLAANSQPQIINLKSNSDYPETYYFWFIKAEQYYLAFGQLNHRELENLRQEIVATNQELGNMMRKLHKSNAELERAITLKNHFLGMAAHDLRSPLSIIKGYTQLLKSTPGNVQNTDSHLNAIEDAADFTLELLNQLLDVAKIESGNFELNKRPNDITALVNSSIDSHRLMAENKAMTITFKLNSAIPRFDFDYLRVQQVLNNLMSNAIKFSPQGSQIRVNLGCVDNNAKISVKDQGPGIEEEKLAELFVPFKTAGTKTTGGETSTGLGLSIAKKIVSLHGGNMEVTSDFGSGSEFSFYLPIN